MNDTQELVSFANEIKDEIANALDDLRSDYPSIDPGAAISEIFLGTLFDAGAIEEAILCAYEDNSGRNRCRVTGYNISQDKTQLLLFTAVSVDGDAISSVPSGKLKDAGLRAARFFDYAIKQDLDRFAEHGDVLDSAQEIHDTCSSIELVTVYIFTDGVVKERSLPDITIQDTQIKFEVFDLQRLKRIRDSGSIRSDILIDFRDYLGRPLACLEMTPRQTDYATYLAIFPGNLIFELYEKYGSKLMEFNVRSYLQARGKVNKGISETLSKVPGRFMAYNNGLVVTADEMDVGQFHGETAINSIRGLQIVNGGQTTASIHRAKKRDSIDLDLVSVPVKITQVSEENLDEFVPLISKFANTQNVIQVADLSANHPFHVALEKLSSSNWCPGEESRWFYERARGAYEVELNRLGTTTKRRKDALRELPKSQKFSKTDLAKWVMVWLGRPHQVCAGAQKNFFQFMEEIDQIFDEKTEPNVTSYKSLIARGIVFKRVNNLMAKLKLPAYRAQVTAYLVAYLDYIWDGDFDFALVWRKQAPSEELMMLFEDWATHMRDALVKAAGLRNVTEWCKKQDCWEEIQELALPFPETLPPELTEYGAQTNSSFDIEADQVQSQGTVECSVSVDSEEHESSDSEIDAGRQLCRTYGTEDWLRIQLWGMSTGRLKTIEWKVAGTLAQYASRGWSHGKPTPKQLVHALKAIEMARHDEIIE